MNKQTYLASLHRALSGLPSDQIDDILRDYEQHFIDALASGRSEALTARALGDPRKVALEFKAMTHLDAFQNKRSLANFGRMAFALVCVAGFNLFLLPFVLVAPLLLLAFYLVSASFFIAGATIAASGLSGVDKIAFEINGRPMALIVHNDADHVAAAQRVARLNVPMYGIHLVDETTPNASVAPTGGDNKLEIGSVYMAVGILFFAFCQKMAGYLGTGTRRYLHANVSMLRGAQNAGA
jgi:uncharacterized membrane protein